MHGHQTAEVEHIDVVLYRHLQVKNVNININIPVSGLSLCFCLFSDFFFVYSNLDIKGILKEFQSPTCILMANHSVQCKLVEGNFIKDKKSNCERD